MDCWIKFHYMFFTTQNYSFLLFITQNFWQNSSKKLLVLVCFGDSFSFDMLLYSSTSFQKSSKTNQNTAQKVHFDDNFFVLWLHKPSVFFQNLNQKRHKIDDVAPRMKNVSKNNFINDFECSIFPKTKCVIQSIQHE